MKINTDGVLLAALAQSESPKRILDIGTGTGVLALMLAQRFADAKVEAVEIDQDAAGTASNNFMHSPFKERMTAHCTAIEDYLSPEKFDLIVSNPPYFVNDFKNANFKKEVARHASFQFFKDLVAKTAFLLSEKGKFWFILPPKQADFVINESVEIGLFVNQIVSIHSDQSKPEIRKIVCLGKESSLVHHSDFYIYEVQNQYTTAYQALLSDFFLIF
ncbi:methyltransferase [Pedobacter sp. CYS-01]|uniref:tRNA1(Val) (adenine(37)-N6)-methyltransferase n=2 Tax=Pedobacter montanisoli TaxID=2923277 RepID=A0ABS9ZZS1_9SPHI|nr:methyltransferase [Pedobacter montanisoli]